MKLKQIDKDYFAKREVFLKKQGDIVRETLIKDGEEDLSPANLSWFMETGGLDRLRNTVKVID